MTYHTVKIQVYFFSLTVADTQIVLVHLFCENLIDLLYLCVCVCVCVGVWKLQAPCIYIIMLIIRVAHPPAALYMYSRAPKQNKIYDITLGARQGKTVHGRCRHRYHVWLRRVAAARGGGEAKQIARLPGRSVLLSARSRRINSFMMTSSIPRDRFVRARRRRRYTHTHTHTHTHYNIIYYIYNAFVAVDKLRH